MHVPDPGANHEMHVNRVARDLVAHDGELQRLLGAFATDRNANRGATWPLEQLGHVARVHVVGRFAVHGDDYVAGANTHTIRRSARKWRNHNDLIISRTDLHSHTV